MFFFLGNFFLAIQCCDCYPINRNHDISISFNLMVWMGMRMRTTDSLVRLYVRYVCIFVHVWKRSQWLFYWHCHQTLNSRNWIADIQKIFGNYYFCWFPFSFTKQAFFETERTYHTHNMQLIFLISSQFFSRNLIIFCDGVSLIHHWHHRQLNYFIFYAQWIKMS